MKDYIAPIGIGLDTCGRITIDKVTNPSGSAQSFAYTTTGVLTHRTFSLTDAAAPRVYSALSPGNYSVTETLPVAGWDLANLVCNDANGSVNLATGTANIVLDANEDVTCTYTNTQRGSLTIQKVTDP